MSEKLITNSFPVKKRTQPITKKFPQAKVKNETIQKTDQHKKEYPKAKDVRDLNILRDFDMRYEYGPCIGITRLQRWTRAHDHDLNPPAEVKEIIEEHKNDTKFTEWTFESLYFYSGQCQAILFSTGELRIWQDEELL